MMKCRGMGASKGGKSYAKGGIVGASKPAAPKPFPGMEFISKGDKKPGKPAFIPQTPFNKGVKKSRGG